jgi:hypothetical protein
LTDLAVQLLEADGGEEGLLEGHEAIALASARLRVRDDLGKSAEGC